MINPKRALPLVHTVSPADVSQGLLEYNYLYKLTGNGHYLDRVNRIRQLMSRIEKQQGLYMDSINCKSGVWSEDQWRSTWAESKYFGILPYLYLQANGKKIDDNNAIEEFQHTIESYRKRKMIWTASQSRLLYLRSYNHQWKELGRNMENHDCSLASMFALGALALAHSKRMNVRSFMVSF